MRDSPSATSKRCQGLAHLPYYRLRVDVKSKEVLVAGDSPSVVTRKCRQASPFADEATEERKLELEDALALEHR